ncbi:MULTISPECIES: anti-sigma factor [Pseudoxanthomonas]|jgi:hypothetical protein|uniref:anti-sigma factor n=1 Tax=Pseudoxanthomonas TaxID=83618 RepID=UPI001613C91C|nr:MULTISPECIES: anti-sigma factor [Pseudoxanthomonas]MBB3277794.1 hypothetical protein [Pseudoxanthomonas sp. OG2]MBD9375976.1 hypothetical protein [Pseudoxanthomonas sp. PXM04]MBV7474466.1 anti-sigma factor [Pseudoxanthomonas sp. PXM05]UBB25977.1 anti-sigma factor [Pseudoxanthomonas japonensis]
MNEENDRLRWQLKGLRQDVPPSRDLWPGIAARIAELPQPSTGSSAGRERVASLPLRARRLVPWAMAASVLLTVGFLWQATHLTSPQEEPLIRQEAVQLTRDYQGALAQIQGAEAHPELGGALQELDRSAEEILAALDRAPNTRFLLEQLRRTYAKRLALTQRAMMS